MTTTFDNLSHNKITHYILPAYQVTLYYYRYVIADVNSRADILPNITLGLVILDDCGSELAALAQSLRFLPIADGQIATTDEQGNYNGTDLYQRGELYEKILK